MRRLLVSHFILLSLILMVLQGLAASSLLPFNSKWTVNDVRQLIAAGAKVNENDNNGLTPLMITSKNCMDAEVIRVLLDAGADVESRDKNGWTALMYAIRYNSNQSIAVLLIERGSPTDGLLDGYSLAEFCQYNGLSDISGALGINKFIFNETTGEIIGLKDKARAIKLSIPSIISGVYVTSIGGKAFYGCSNLTSVTIPSSVTSIGDQAFNNCDELTNIYVDSRNRDYSSIKGVLYNKEGTELIRYPEGRADPLYIIPSNVNYIVDYAFSGCSYKLTSITIPNSVTCIGSHAFYECRGLTSITIPESVTRIEEGAFGGRIVQDASGGCNRLEDINVDSRNTNYSSINGVLYNKERTELLRYPEGRNNSLYTIPNGVTSIGVGAFYGCSILTSITIPDSVTSIGDGAFSGCLILKSITIPDSVTSIGDGAFTYCCDLTHITIPDGVNIIEEDAFYNCYDLASITIPKSITSIGNRAFSCCFSLNSIKIPDSVASIGDGAFNGCYRLKEISVDSRNTNYSSINGVLYNQERTKLIRYPEGRADSFYVIPNGVTSIRDKAFYSCSGLTSITIPNSVTSIGDGAFEHCKNLISITIPSSVASIGDNTFCFCYSLTVVTISNSVTSIGERAFYECWELTSVTIPSSVTSIGDQAFSGCERLTNIYIDSRSKDYSSINGILCNREGTVLLCYPGGRANSPCIIPNSVTSIGDGAFSECNNLTTITIPNRVTSIGRSAFAWCDNLTSITIPNSVTSIGDRAFEYCHSLTSITIPSSVASIGEGAFERFRNGLIICGMRGSYAEKYAYDNGIKFFSANDLILDVSSGQITRCISQEDSCIIPAYIEGKKVMSVGVRSFSYSNNLKNVVIEDGLISIGEEAFLNCNNLFSITIPPSVTRIAVSAFDGCNNLKICCDIGSYAERFAKENRIPIVERKAKMQGG